MKNIIYIVYGRSHNYDLPECSTPPLAARTSKESADAYAAELQKESDRDAHDELIFYVEQIEVLP